MEIPVISNVLKRVEDSGKVAGGKWVEQHPERIQAIQDSIVADLKDGRDPSKPYVNPVKNAYRKGLVEGAGDRVSEIVDVLGQDR